MRIFFSELCLVNGNLLDNVKSLIDCGADYIELMLDGTSWDGFENKMDELCLQLADFPVTYAIHSPVWNFNLTAGSGYIRKATMEAYKDSIIFAHELKASHVVLHPGFSDIPFENKKELIKRSREAMVELSDFNKSYEVDLLIENVGNDTASIFNMEEYVDFLDGNKIKYVSYLRELAGH